MLNAHEATAVTSVTASRVATLVDSSCSQHCQHFPYLSSRMSDTFGHLKAAPASRDAIEREVARDGMATVYLAEDLTHRRNVAINVGARRS